MVSHEARGRPLSGETAESLSSAFQKSQSNKEATLEHFLAISPHTLPCMDAVYDMVRKVYESPAGDPVEDLDVIVAIWGVFMNATLKAATHLGNDHDVNLRNGQNSSWRTAGQLFGDIEKLISGQTETTGINLIDSQDFKVDIDEFVAQSSISIRHCQGPRLFRLGAVLGENGRQPCWIQEEKD